MEKERISQEERANKILDNIISDTKFSAKLREDREWLKIYFTNLLNRSRKSSRRKKALKRLGECINLNYAIKARARERQRGAKEANIVIAEYSIIIEDYITENLKLRKEIERLEEKRSPPINNG